MAFTEEKFNKQLAVAKIKLEEILELSTSGYVEDISLANEQIGALISRLENQKDGTIDFLIETDKELEYIKQWTADQKVAIQPFRDARYGIKKKLDEFTKDETQEALEKQPSFFAHGPIGRTSAIYRRKFHTDDASAYFVILHTFAKSALRSTEGQRRANKAQVTTTKGNRSGHDAATTARRRMVLEKTRLRKTDRRNPSRISGRRRFRKTRDVFNAIGKITKVHNLALFR